MGALYLAVTGDRGLERLLAIKTVLPHLADSEYMARFRDEAKVVVKLSHGNLVPVFDAGQVSGELFLAMDFVEGRDLRAVWNRCAKKQVAFPVDVAVYLVKELCRGLHYAHTFPDLALVHRDISPPNILVSFSGEVKLTDFGLASSSLKMEKTAPGIIYGKVAYMSPEQARGEKLDGRSDQYALAIVLWELLTGRQLFPPGKDQPQDLINRSKNPGVTPPSQRASRVPKDLDAICLRALAPSRDERYESCDQFRQALQTWLAVHAPTTDAVRVSGFLHDLFDADIADDRANRAALINRLQTRAMTLPPTDELRQILQRGGADGADEPGGRSPGRRASDRGDLGNDRRQAFTRRGSSDDGLLPPATDGNLALDASDADPQDLAGVVLEGRYRIDRLIGEGGMGMVYLGEHMQIGRKVAIKVLHQSYSRMPELLERFRREARAASRIGHPNIVDITDSGNTPGGSAYFVMEYLDGVELAQELERQGALSLQRAAHIGISVCRALAAAHAVGIIHRDLKPENIFLLKKDGGPDVVKVLDFGIAKTAEAEEVRERRLTSPGMTMGTPEYMAPEQAAGKLADVRSDIYSVGAVLYEMLTGVPPYYGENFLEILTKKATVDPQPTVALRKSIPASVDALVMRAMARDPSARQQTMAELEADLARVVAEEQAAFALAPTGERRRLSSLPPMLSPSAAESVGQAAFVSPLTPTLPFSPFDSHQGLASAVDVANVSSPSHSGLVTPMEGSHSSVPYTDAVVRVKPSSWTTLAGIVLGASVIAILGILLYAAAGERNGGDAKAAAQAEMLMTGKQATLPVPSPAPPVAIEAAPVSAQVPPMAGAATQADAAAPPPAPSSDVTSRDSSNERGTPKSRPSTRKETVRVATPKRSDDAVKLLDRADKLASQGETATARVYYDAVLDSNMLAGRAYLGLGRLELAANPKKAAALFEKAAAKGASVDANRLLAPLYEKLGEPRKAAERYEWLMESDPKRKAEWSRALSRLRAR
ncbi:MAG: serine/threonine protein kinase [Myxococcales bacterium]|nr:serine/threonine protein kinase [Myxococcales bacterium]